MEIGFERDARVFAPAPLVWAEMDSLEAVLHRSPQLLSFVMRDGGERADVTTKLTWGPLKYEVEGTASVRETVPNQLLVFAVEVPRLELEYVGRMTLTSVSAGETTLRYTGHLELSHKRASRLRGLFHELIEEHMHALVGRVKARAEHRRLADERLLQ